MIGSFLALALTLLLGGAVAYPLTNEINMVDQPSTSYAQYGSSSQLLTAGMYNFDGFLNVSLTDINFLSYYDDNGYWYFNDTGVHYEANNYNTPSYAFNYLANKNAYLGFYVEFDGPNEYYITPYWQVFNFTNYGYNDTFWFYMRDDADEGVLTYGYAYVNHNEFRIDEYVGYKYKESLAFSGGTFAQTTILNLDTNQKIFAGGGLQIEVYNTSSATYPIWFDFGVGLEEINYSTYSEGYTDGYNDGYDSGYTTGYNQGSSDGYSLGYADGVSLNSTDFNSLFFAIADTPVLMIRSLFNFDLFGMNVFVAIMTMLTGILVIYIVKKVI